MEIRVSMLPTLDAVRDDVDVAIVIDVLRATSAITTALAAGANRVWTVPTVDEAFALRQRMQASGERRALLCGERQCRPIEGFDLGNSPAEYTATCVQDRELIFSTTNGTRAVESAKPAQDVWLASFLNRSAVVAALANGRPDTSVVHFVCSGTDGEVTREDVLLAGSLVESLVRGAGAELANDQARIAKAAYGLAVDESDDGECEMLAAEFHDCLGGRNLLTAGYAEDFKRCAAVDVTSHVPRRESRSGTASFASSPPPRFAGEVGLRGPGGGRSR